MAACCCMLHDDAATVRAEQYPQACWNPGAGPPSSAHAQLPLCLVTPTCASLLYLHRVLLLDEATSALDAENEHLVQVELGSAVP